MTAPTSTAAERETAIALLDVLFAGRIRDFDEERAQIIADALARHRVEVAERCAIEWVRARNRQRNSDARFLIPSKRVREIANGATPLGRVDEQIAAILGVQQ